MNIAKALKTKNRLAGELSKVRSTITKYNSQLVNAADKVDINAALEKHKTLTNSLVKLKARISIYNKNVQEKIYLLSELKGQMIWLETIQTTHGDVDESSRYGAESKTRTYEATLRKADKDRMLEEIQNQINDVQDELDAHNATAKIDVDDLL